MHDSTYGNRHGLPSIFSLPQFIATITNQSQFTRGFDLVFIYIKLIAFVAETVFPNGTGSQSGKKKKGAAVSTHETPSLFASYFAVALPLIALLLS
jgi:hypothetical protein